MSKSIGVVGLGIMGFAISGNFLKSGYEVAGFDINEAQAAKFAANGGTAVGSPAEVAAQCDIVLTLLPSSAALDAVCTGADGFANAGTSDFIMMECSTLPIEDKQRNHEAMTAAGIIAESAYYESLHETPLIANTIARKKLYEMNATISDTAEYGCYLYNHACVPLLADFMKGIKSDVIGKGLDVDDNGVDNARLIEVNDALRAHPMAVLRNVR